MEVKNGPFSIYDFLGYFFPGAFAIFIFAYCSDVLGMSLHPLTVDELGKVSNLLPFILSSYVLGHAIALMSSFTIERYYIWSFDYPSKALLRYEGKPFITSEMSSNIVRILVAVLLLPISMLVTLVCWFTQKKLGMVHQLDSLLARMIRRKVTALIVDAGQISRPNDYVGPRECDFFRLVYHYTVENCPAHLPKMQNYVALFGFNRAASFVFVSIFWLSAITLFFGRASKGIQGMLIAALLANVFFFGFAKFYRRFSLESLMALGANYRIPDTIRGVKLPAAPKKKRIVGKDLKTQNLPATKFLSGFQRRLRLSRKGS